ncbi:FprA family A-type flavoprotein [Ruminococcaceae bacterium OttesenSCG-928-I18]|nr:FprA family A-type flavoprotein [Ruminococcaceae bacterium OttesenSCG-928-I18]
MGAVLAKDRIWSVGVLDKDLRVFDIIMETKNGTTYNSFLVKGDEKTVLFEAVKDKFCEEFFANIREVCDPAEIDYVVCNHTEPDHSGCLKRLLELAPKATVLGSNTAITFLGEILNEEFPHRVVTEKDEIDLGGLTLRFFSTPMLHWPDTQFSYIPELKALFSCDVFGCHYADDRIFNDLIGQAKDFIDAYKYYFDNIMGPYKNPHIGRALDKIKDLSIEFIGNGHGPVLRQDIPSYIQMYREWSKSAQNPEKTVVIVYVSAYGYTRSLANQMAEGLKEGGVKRVEMYDLVEDDMDAAKCAIEAADGILLGSPTLVGDALPPIYEAMLCLNPVIHRGKFAGAFGSYGWSGEAVQNISSRLDQLHMTLPLPGLRVRLQPKEEDLEEARKFGADFAKAMLEA